MITRQDNNQAVIGLSLSDQLQHFDATDFVSGLRDGRWTARELVEAHFERIDYFNPVYKSLVTLNERVALEQAEDADAGHDFDLPLRALPISVKDALLTRALLTTAGCQSLRHNLAERDAGIVATMKQAGAIVIGKGNCAPRCVGFQTGNSLFGVTLNPWNARKTAGGSTGGDAVAVALGLSAIGIGSDTAGSLRIPASYCGVYALKPTYGSLSADGLISGYRGESDHLTTIGFLARSVRDLILCWTAAATMAGSSRTEEPHEPTVLPWTLSFEGMPVSDDVSGVILRAIEALSIDGGFDPLPVSPPFALKAVYDEAMDLIGQEVLDPETVPASGPAPSRSCAELLRAGEERAMQLDALLQQYGCWVLPATATVAFDHNKHHSPISAVVDEKTLEIPYTQAAAGFTVPFNFTGHPVVVIPVGRDREGLPVAIQLVGPKGGELALLQLADRVESVIAGTGRRGIDDMMSR